MAGSKKMTRKEENDRIIDSFLSTFPPHIKWNTSVLRSEYIKLNQVLRKRKYTMDECIDAISYAKMKNKQYKTISSIAYIIEESKLYWEQRHAREEEQRKLAEQVVSDDVWIDTTQSKTPQAPSWLGSVDFGEVD